MCGEKDCLDEYAHTTSGVSCLMINISRKYANLPMSEREVYCIKVLEEQSSRVRYRGKSITTVFTIEHHIIALKSLQLHLRSILDREN